MIRRENLSTIDDGEVAYDAGDGDAGRGNDRAAVADDGGGLYKDIAERNASAGGRDQTGICDAATSANITDADGYAGAARRNRARIDDGAEQGLVGECQRDSCASGRNDTVVGDITPKVEDALSQDRIAARQYRAGIDDAAGNGADSIKKDGSISATKITPELLISPANVVTRMMWMSVAAAEIRPEFVIVPPKLVVANLALLTRTVVTAMPCISRPTGAPAIVPPLAMLPENCVPLTTMPPPTEAPPASVMPPVRSPLS